MEITGIILAGGKSTRMGTDKALLQINGKTLLENAIEICMPVCSEILISSNNPEHQKLGIQIIPDEIKDCGPMGGIYSCLKVSETSWNLVLSTDAIYVEPLFISFLINHSGDFDAVVPIHSKGKEPLIALYNKSSLPIIKEHIAKGNFKMVDLLSEINTRWINSENWIQKTPNIFQNINSPTDLNQAIL